MVGIAVINLVEHRVDVEVSPKGTGTVAVTGNQTRSGYYEQGSTVTLVATPAKGQRFVGWTVDGVAKGTGPLTLTVAKDTSVVATFATA